MKPAMNTLMRMYTVNSEIYARILFSRIALKDKFATFKIRNLGMVNDRVISLFREGLFSRNSASTKFRENKTLAKIFRIYSMLATHASRMFVKIKLSRNG